MTGKRFEIVEKEKGKYDNGISIEDKVIGINHQMLDCGSAKDVCELLNELSDESEQLRKENYELHKRLGDFEPFEKYIKERTSKTSVNDIIGLVKTDEPTNSVELKKELYK